MNQSSSSRPGWPPRPLNRSKARCSIDFTSCLSSLKIVWDSTTIGLADLVSGFVISDTFAYILSSSMTKQKPDSSSWWQGAAISQLQNAIDITERRTNKHRELRG